MKTGLSQRGWNNVLIFASLFMIVLFNSTHQKFVSNDNNTVKRTFIEPSNIIQKLDFSGLLFERIGSNWRTVTSIKLDEKLTPQNYIKNWQQVPNEVLTADPEISTSMTRFPISVDVMGDSVSSVFEFIIDNDVGVVYIFDHQKTQWMIIDQAQLSLFIPSVLIELDN